MKGFVSALLEHELKRAKGEVERAKVEAERYKRELAASSGQIVHWADVVTQLERAREQLQKRP